MEQNSDGNVPSNNELTFGDFSEENVLKYCTNGAFVLCDHQLQFEDLPQGNPDVQVVVKPQNLDADHKKQIERIADLLCGNTDMYGDGELGDKFFLFFGSSDPSEEDHHEEVCKPDDAVYDTKDLNFKECCVCGGHCWTGNGFIGRLGTGYHYKCGEEEEEREWESCW